MRPFIALVVLVSTIGSIYTGWSFYVENQRRKEAELRQAIGIANRAQQVTEEGLNQGRQLHQLLGDLQDELNQLAQFTAIARKEAQERASRLDKLAAKHQEAQTALVDFTETSEVRRKAILRNLEEIEVLVNRSNRLSKDQVSQITQIKALLTEIERQVDLGQTLQDANSTLLDKIRHSASEIHIEAQKLDDAKVRQDNLQGEQNKSVQNVESLTFQLQAVKSRIESIKLQIKRDAQ